MAEADTITNINQSDLEQDRNQDLELVLEKIATEANILRAVLSSEGADDPIYYRVYAEKIGYLADAGLKQLTGNEQCVGSAEAWFIR